MRSGRANYQEPDLQPPWPAVARVRTGAAPLIFSIENVFVDFDVAVIL
jgi:hypothetical protein